MKWLYQLADSILDFFEQKVSKNFLYYQIKPYKYNEYEISQNLGFLYNFAGLDDEIDFAIVWNWAHIKMVVRLPESLGKYFENCFYANFPDSEVSLLEDYQKIEALMQSHKKYIHFKFESDGDFKLVEDFMKNWVYLEPLKDVLSVFNNLSVDDELLLGYDVKFVLHWNLLDKVKKWIYKILKISSESRQKDMLVAVYFTVNSSDSAIKKLVSKSLQTTFRKYLTVWDVEISSRLKFYKQSFEQFVNFFHILNKTYFIKAFDYLTYKKLPAPTNLPTLKNTDKNKITLLWETDYKNYDLRFWIKEEDKLRHCYIIWKTWMWKSTLISNMVRSDLISNKWVCIIDPHGDLIDTVLQYVPSWRINDVILFDVSDFDYPIWFNILQTKSEEEKNIVVSGIVATFKKLYENSWGPRLEYVLRNSLLSVINYPNATLLHLTRILTDKNFLNEVLEYVDDPIVLKFWKDEFMKRSDNFRNEAISPIVNKVWQFLSSPIVRNIFWQTRTKLDIRKIMDEGKILLVNLSKWKVGEDNASMIGSFLVTKFQIEAMGRADIPFNQRKPFYLYIDEFQNFATDSFESILSEARKYKLSLIMANQYISQISENIKNAIFGNVGTIISFGIGYEDAEMISKQFKEAISSMDLLSLPKFRAYIKLMIDGVISDSFSMKTFPLPEPENGVEIKEKVRKQTRQAYAVEKSRIEKVIKLWAEKKFSLTDKALEKAQSDDAQIIEFKDLNKDVWYEWIVKLKYNFGLFVVLKGGKVEGLLHKSKIKVPDGIRWKDLYQIGDKIKVKVYDLSKATQDGKNVQFTQI